MIYKFNLTLEHQLAAVPKNSYYLAETKQFADFEIDEIIEIKFHSPNKNELEEFCKVNNFNLEGPWAIYHIGQKL